MIDGINTVKCLEDKNVIMLLGPTGSGKSTVANSLIKGPQHLQQDIDTKVISAEPIKKENGEQVFSIGHSSTSHTSIPGFYEIEEDLFLVDCPGFGDSDRYNELPNMTLVHKVIQSAKSVVFCFVVKGASIESKRGARYLEVMTSLARMMSSKGV